MGRRSKDGAVGKEADFGWGREAELCLYSGEWGRALEITGSPRDPSLPFISLRKPKLQLRSNSLEVPQKVDTLRMVGP